jgi:hypothetical protein
MRDNAAAVDQMNAYRSRMIFSAVSGGAGGFLVGWPLGATLAGDDWNGTYTGMTVAGGVLIVAAAISGASATSHLKEAVRLFNGEVSGVGLDLRLLPDLRGPEAGIRLALTWRR